METPVTPFDLARAEIRGWLSGNAPVRNGVYRTPLWDNHPRWAEEAALLIAGHPLIGIESPVLRMVLAPMLAAEACLEDDDLGIRRFTAAEDRLRSCPAQDWRNLCMAYIEERRRGV